jgi:hypothetical protein
MMLREPSRERPASRESDDGDVLAQIACLREGFGSARFELFDREARQGRRELVRVAMVRQARDHDVVSALEEHAAEGFELLGARGQPVQQHERSRGAAAVLEGERRPRDLLRRYGPICATPLRNREKPSEM